MSDWLDVGETTGCAEPNEKGCMIAAIFVGVIALALIVLCMIYW